MLRPATYALCLTLSVAGCARLAESRFNPLNWFGGSQNVQTPADRSQLAPLVPANARGQIVDARVLIDQITALEIAPSPGGAIIRATGVAATQGFYNAQLVLVSTEDGVATYAFRVEAPTDFAAQGTVASRTITAATVLDNRQLAGIRQVTVQAARNARTARR